MANMMSNECVFSTLTAGRVVLSQIEETLFAAIAALNHQRFLYTHIDHSERHTAHRPENQPGHSHMLKHRNM